MVISPDFIMHITEVIILLGFALMSLCVIAFAYLFYLVFAGKIDFHGHGQKWLTRIFIVVALSFLAVSTGSYFSFNFEANTKPQGAAVSTW